MLVAGEASGDGYGARLVQALRDEQPDVRFFGMGAQAMRAQGVHLLFDVTGRGAIGFVESLREYPLYRRVLARLAEGARRLKPDVAVLIDFPGFNLRLGPLLARMGIPVVYYVAPAVWAWGAGRARAVAAFASRVICVFEFEVPLYRQAGAPAEWLGHPILDDVPQRPPAAAALREVGLAPGGPVVALLPGSRFQEIQTLYPVMVRAAQAIHAARPDVRFVASVAPGIDSGLLVAAGGVAHRELGIRLVGGGIWRSLAVAETAVVAAGTAALQAALWQVPMVVVYRVSEATYWLAKRLVRVSHVSLPNIVAGRPVVEELLQHDARPERVAQALLDRLERPDRLASERQELSEVRRRLGEPGAARRAARVVLEVAGR